MFRDFTRFYVFSLLCLFGFECVASQTTAESIQNLEVFMTPKLKVKKVDLVINFDAQDVFIFKDSLQKEGVDLYQSAMVDVNSKSEKIVVFNSPISPDCLSTLPKEKLVYFLWEPWEVALSYYQYYSRVYTWDDDLVDNVKFFKFYYPYLMPMAEILIPFKERKLCVMVAGADINPKGRNNDLYCERIKMVDFFETKPKGEFELYGKSWTSRFYRDYVGSIPGFHSGQEKISILKKYRFSICFENTQNVNGYITEKIFGCFAAGCVPIYWGAKNIDTYIPKNCYIDYRDFKTPEDLYLFIKNMPESAYEQYLDNIRSFIKSEKAQIFTPAYLQKTFCEAVNS